SSTSAAAAMAHPEALAQIMTDVACSSGACGIEILPTLGLPLDETGTLMDPDGGLYGARAHVALGIVEAVTRWKQEVNTGDPGTRLVINLSVGWVADRSTPGCGASEAEPWCGSHANELNSFLTLPVNNFPTRVAIESVHAALLYATCNGAVVVASAGNTKGDSCNADPVAPATWGEFAAPTMAECNALGLIDTATPWTSNFDVGRPLLHPVSGVEPDGGPIALTRPGSETRLAAAGSHATAGSEMALTGTSVSAAVTSSAFALLWSMEPSSAPGAVAQRVISGGNPLPRLSELVEFGAPAGTPMRNLSLCGALTAQALATGTAVPLACPSQSSLTVAIAEMDDAVHDLLINEFDPALEIDASSVAMENDACMACGDPLDVWLPDLESDSEHYLFGACAESPASFVPSSGPSIAGPQPDVPVCPDCPLVAGASEYVALLSIDDEYRTGVTFVGASLVLQVGATKTSYDVGALLGDVTELQDETRVKISIPGAGTVPRKAVFEAKLTNDKTGKGFYRSSELLISRGK
ncbi:MAG: S8/S53 family peptidase, partial [Nannocystaceae bacterium]|nr:S8/S53 family peptidase [Nannocystaceae bacterium]